MDNLTACAIEARKLGMTYGQYMAQKKGMPIHTKPDPVPVSVSVRYCKECGKPIRPECSRKLYCSDDCARVANARRAKEKNRKAKGISEDDILVCPCCKKEFVRGNRHGCRKYCSPECSYEMKMKQIRKEI